MLQVGDTIWNGFAVILAIRDDYHTFEVKILGGAPNGFTITFQPEQTAADITALLTGPGPA